MGVEESAAVREGEVDAGGGGECKCAGHCEELEAAAEGLSPLGEAQVVGVRRVDTLKSMEYCTSDLKRTSKKTQLNLRRVERDNGLLPKTTSKTSWNDMKKCFPLCPSSESCLRWR